MFSGFPDGLVGKEFVCSAGDKGDVDLTPGLGGSRGGGNSSPLQYSCVENPMDRGTWPGYSPWGCKESDTTEHTAHMNTNAF